MGVCYLFSYCVNFQKLGGLVGMCLVVGLWFSIGRANSDLIQFLKNEL